MRHYKPMRTRHIQPCSERPGPQLQLQQQLGMQLLWGPSSPSHHFLLLLQGPGVWVQQAARRVLQFFIFCQNSSPTHTIMLTLTLTPTPTLMLILTLTLTLMLALTLTRTIERIHTHTHTQNILSHTHIHTTHENTHAHKDPDTDYRHSHRHTNL
mmetsp:Transcript_92269/g.134883  ORF Transcript_92269/g.134883 Transcript_92269/m.134883 type:complete len:155 (-) Transcript_92269:33-497(-)